LIFGKISGGRVSAALPVDVGQSAAEPGGLEIRVPKLRITCLRRPTIPDVLAAVREGIAVYERPSARWRDCELIDGRGSGTCNGSLKPQQMLNALFTPPASNTAVP